MDCMAIDNADVRRACIGAAQQQSEQTPRTEQPVRSVQPVPTEQPVRAEQPARTEQPVLTEQPVRTEQPIQGEPQQESRDPPRLEEQTVGPQREPSRSTRDAPQAEVSPLREPADSFTAEVTRVHQSILDRQLIALDNSYLFVSDRASQARLKAGQSVEVRRGSSRFRSGRNWRITGPSRSPIEAFRIRCESDELGSDNRRRCARMLDR